MDALAEGPGNFASARGNSSALTNLLLRRSVAVVPRPDDSSPLVGGGGSRDSAGAGWRVEDFRGSTRMPSYEDGVPGIRTELQSVGAGRLRDGQDGHRQRAGVRAGDAGAAPTGNRDGTSLQAPRASQDASQARDWTEERAVVVPGRGVSTRNTSSPSPDALRHPGLV